MLVRYLPLIFVLAGLGVALAPLEAPAQSASGLEATPQPEHKADKPRPATGGAPVDSQADKTPTPAGADPRQVRPAQAFPPERIAPSRPAARTPQAPSRGGVQTPDPPRATPGPRGDDPRSVEERPDPG